MSKIKDIQIQFQPFSISSLTNGNVARCKIGIVEMQLLRAVDLVIYHKIRWIESVKIKAKQRAQTAVIVNDRLVSVKLNGENWIEQEYEDERAESLKKTNIWLEQTVNATKNGFLFHGNNFKICLT